MQANQALGARRLSTTFLFAPLNVGDAQPAALRQPILLGRVVTNGFTCRRFDCAMYGILLEAEHLSWAVTAPKGKDIRILRWADANAALTYIAGQRKRLAKRTR